MKFNVYVIEHWDDCRLQWRPGNEPEVHLSMIQADFKTRLYKKARVVPAVLLTGPDARPAKPKRKAKVRK